MRLFGLIGYPLGHSFSKKYFTEKFEKEGLQDCAYELFPLTSITQLPALIKKHPELRGLNVTIPYKKSVLEYLDSTVGLPPGLPACNCILIENGNLTGYNTDYIGFEKSLLPLLENPPYQALVLGQGGASEAVVFVLKKNKINYHIVSRSRHGDATYTYSDLDEKKIREHNLIINTTPLGMEPHTETFPAIPYSAISDQHILFDLVYNPAKTEFLKKGEERGAKIKNGEEMLIIQAEENWKIWNKKSGR